MKKIAIHPFFSFVHKPYIVLLSFVLLAGCTARHTQYRIGVSQLSRRDEAFIERVREIVDAHLTDPEFGVESLGSMLQLSRTQLFRRMKKIADVAPMDYIRERWLVRADELLRTTDMTIRQVALELCFSKPAYFSKCYKDYFGYLPSTVKK